MLCLFPFSFYLSFFCLLIFFSLFLCFTYIGFAEIKLWLMGDLGLYVYLIFLFFYFFHVLSYFGFVAVPGGFVESFACELVREVLLFYVVVGVVVGVFVACAAS